MKFNFDFDNFYGKNIYLSNRLRRFSCVILMFDIVIKCFMKSVSVKIVGTPG